MARATFLTVSDTDIPFFPVDEDDLNKRLASIAYWIPKRPGNNNMEFVKEAFILIKDCGLITPILVDNFSNKKWCFSTFDCTMNPMPDGGILREAGAEMWSNNGLRYYCPFKELTVASDITTAMKKRNKGASRLVVICEDKTYYISNNWYDDENRFQKRNFYKWLEKVTHQTCKKRWL